MKKSLLVSLSLTFFTSASANTELLEKLVSIGSGSQQVTQVNQVQNIIKDELKNLGFNVQLIPPPLDIKSGDLLVAELPGKTKKFVTLIVHADTVFEPSSESTKFQVSEDGKTAIGPGVIDNKGGIVVLIEGLKKFLATPPQFSVRVVSSPSEEVGSHGFAKLFATYSQDSFLALGLEPALESGNIISSRKGNRWYIVTVEGKEAHAGRAHQDGINACVKLGDILSKASKLTNYSKKVTVSVGRIEGGQDKFNIVCGSAQAKVDTRFASFETRNQLHKRLDKLFTSGSKGSLPFVSYTVKNDSLPFSRLPEADEYLKRYLQIIQKIESVPVSHEASGGSADTNEFARPGLPIIDGLGPVGGKMHTKDEFIVLSSLQSRAAALAEFLRQI